ncbi:hypothetical protein M0813_04267 [Anaeramoeba flamelloides]|uniref:Uncharacterized protein n=1 Tax=Anaeramoeba flamelloides TaxID=1746091 RepID=A0ABQ8XLK7_9EUKA|nr:hypothetical protein M0813_04267 [Anaeramoeba flamelloides]
MLSCLILANELVNQEGVTKEYADLVDLEYNGDIINLYLNNRGKKTRTDQRANCQIPTKQWPLLANPFNRIYERT